MAKKKAQQVLDAIRRNTGYAAGRAFGLVSSVILVIACAGIGALLGADREQEAMLAFILTGALGGLVPALLLNHVANAIFDGADSLVQIAKFQERSLRKRNDAIGLVEKIREEVEAEADSENPQASVDENPRQEAPSEVVQESEHSPENPASEQEPEANAPGT